MKIDAIHHAALSVSDFDAAVAWWAKMFDFALTDEWTAGDIRIGIVAQGAVRIELFCKPGAAPGPDETLSVLDSFGARGWKHVALSVTDLPAAVAVLEAKGATVFAGPDTAPPGFAYAFLRDPDGNQVELVQPA